MSKLCDSVIEVVKEAFPELKIVTEEFVKYKNQKLYLDIFLPQLGIIIEVHGKQHDKFTSHFHKDADDFKRSKKRDSLKEEWAGENDYIYIVFREKDLPIDVERLLESIDEASYIE